MVASGTRVMATEKERVYTDSGFGESEDYVVSEWVWGEREAFTVLTLR